MPLNPLESSTINRGIALARRVLEEIKPIIDGLNVAYDTPTTGVKATVNQQDLDDTPSLSGITEAQLDDGFFALTDAIRTAINNNYFQLATLASRG